MSMNIRSQLAPTFNGLHTRICHFAFGSFPCRTGSTYSWNRLLLVAETGGGRAFFSDDSRRYPVEAGGVFLLPAFRKAGVVLDEETRFVSIHFNMELFEGSDIFAELPGIWSAVLPQLAAETRRIFREPDELTATVALKMLLYQVAWQVVPGLPDHLRGMLEKWRAYQPLLAIFNRELPASVTVDSLAEAMKMRHDVFTRKFTRDIGISPKTFLTRQLLRRASELLLTRKEPIRDIAARLGFNNEFYFSRFFRKHTGLAPGSYRKGLQ